MTIERLYRALPVLYLVWALPLVAGLCWLIPPWQSPDEGAHLARADQVAHGAWWGARRDGHAGAVSDAAIPRSLEAVAGLVFHPEAKLTGAMLGAADAPHWGERAFIGNANTIQYPPFLYLPQAVAVRVGQALGLSVMGTLRLARLANALAAVLVTMAALRAARRSAPLLAALALLPMTLALFASASQDALLIACSLLAAGLVDRVATEEREARRLEAAAVTVLLALVVMARPPYAPLALLVVPLSRRIGRATLLRAGAIVVAGVGWMAAVLLLVSVKVHGADPAGQLRFMVEHPARAVAAFGWTWRAGAGHRLRELVGQLGWLDAPVPDWFFALAVAVLALAWLATIGGRGRRSVPVLLGALLASAGVSLAMYLTWTPVGERAAWGLQGRYLTPILAAAALGLPGLPRLGAWLRPAGLVGLAALAATAPAALLQALVLRYYFA